MIVPFDKSQRQSENGRPATQRPSETDLLLALAEMHRQGRFAELTQKDQPMLEESIRTARGINTGREGAMREKDLQRPPLDIDKVMRPGQPLPDRRLGVPGSRDVRGI